MTSTYALLWARKAWCVCTVIFVTVPLYRFQTYAHVHFAYEKLDKSPTPCDRRVDASLDRFWTHADLLGVCGIQLSYDTTTAVAGSSYCNEFVFQGDFCRRLQIEYMFQSLPHDHHHHHHNHHHHHRVLVEGCVNSREPEVFWPLYALPCTHTNDVDHEYFEDLKDYEEGRIIPRSCSRSLFCKRFVIFLQFLFVMLHLVIVLLFLVLTNCI